MNQNPTQLTTEQAEQLSAFTENNEKALMAFYQRNYPGVEKYVLENGGDENEAKDVFQDAFLTVWRNVQLKKYTPQAGKTLEHYLHRIARNKWIDYLRASKRRSSALLDQETEAVEMDTSEDSFEEQVIAHVKDNLKLLGRQCQEILERFYYRRESMKTIAAGLNLTEASAKNNKYRCMHRLRELIKNNSKRLG